MKKLKLLLKASWYVLREPIANIIGIIVAVSVMAGLSFGLVLIDNIENIENIENILINVVLFLFGVGGLLLVVAVMWSIADVYEELSKKEEQ